MADSQVNIFAKTIKWKELAPLPVGRTAHTAVLLGGSVYVGGGYEGTNSNDKQNCNRLDVYNLTTNQWSSSPITTPLSWFAMAVLDDKLVIAGGKTKNYEVVKKVLVLNTGQWEDYSEMPTARCNATAVGYHSMLIVIAGQIKVEGRWTPISTTELLDATNECWYTCNNLPFPHRQMKAVILNDQLYLLGGVDEDLKISLQVFVCSLDTLSTYQLNWQSAQDTPWGFSSPVVYCEFLLAVGGRQPSDITSQTLEVHALNPSTGQWKYLTNIPAALSFPAAVSMDDKLIVIGGLTNKNKGYCYSAWTGVFE